MKSFTQEKILFIFLLLFWSVFLAFAEEDQGAIPEVQKEKEVAPPEGSPNVVRLNNSAVEQLADKDGDDVKALSQLMAASLKEPFNPVLKLNIGIYQFKEKDLIRSRKYFLSALRHFGGDNPSAWKEYKGKFLSVLPTVLFNIATSYHFDKEMGPEESIPKALHYYQRVLMFAPDSKEVKTNIELLTNSPAGKGKGEGKSKDKNKDQKDSDDGKQQNKDKDKNKAKGQKDKPDRSDGPPKKKKQKQEFKSQELSKSDVRKFLEEIKAQEQKIRAKELKKSNKGGERQRDKDW